MKSVGAGHLTHRKNPFLYLIFSCCMTGSRAENRVPVIHSPCQGYGSRRGVSAATGGCTPSAIKTKTVFITAEARKLLPHNPPVSLCVCQINFKHQLVKNMKPHSDRTLEGSAASLNRLLLPAAVIHAFPVPSRSFVFKIDAVRTAHGCMGQRKNSFSGFCRSET